MCLEFSKTELKEYITDNYYEQNIDIYKDIEYDKNETLKGFGMYPCWIGQFQQLAASVKHEYWKLEKEFRLIFGVKYIEDNRFEVKENYNKKYDNRYKTQDYIEVKIPKTLVKSITTGPLCKSDKGYLLDKLKETNIQLKQSIGTGIINNPEN